MLNEIASLNPKLDRMCSQNVSKFVIFSLPRSGSTALCNLLNCHEHIRCLSEPFNPQRFEGRFHSSVLDQSRLDSTIEDIWTQWNGIKHVCDWTGWPFLRKPELNAQILLGPNRRILFLTRRNLLRRFISWYISLETGFWGGTKEEFYSKLERVQLESLNPEWVIEQLRHDRDTLSAYSRILVENDIPAMHIVYEHFFRFDATDLEHLDVLNSVLGFLHFEPITLALYRSKWRTYFTRGDDEFSSAEIYRRIPGIERLENEVGSDETGWLFR